MDPESSLPASVSDSTLWRLLAAQTSAGLRRTVTSQVRRLLKPPGPSSVALPLGVMSFDGKSLWTSVQREVDGLEAVACDEAGTPVWRLGTLRAVRTRHRAAPCVDLEFLGAKEGESPAFRQLLPRVDQLPVAWARACEVLRDALVHRPVERRSIALPAPLLKWPCSRNR